MKVTIKQDKNSTVLSELTLDGKPVELRYLKTIKLDMTAGEVPQLTLNYFPREVEIELVDSEVTATDEIIYDSLESR